MSFPTASAFPNHWAQPLKDLILHERMDAEHFHPFYSAIENVIKAGGSYAALDSLVSYCKRGQQPQYVPGGDVLVVNSQHVGEHFINIEAAARTSDDFWIRSPKARVVRHDVLVNSTGLGTIGRVNCVLHDEKTVVDNHVTIIRVKPGAINPLYLAVFLNSKLGREQTYKWQSGSSGQLELYPGDIRRFLVVLPDKKTQGRIAKGLSDAYDAARLASVAASKAESDVVGLV